MRESTHLSIKKAAGKNSRSAAIYLPRPTSVTSSHGALDFHWSKARRYSPPASLLSQFLALGDGEQILQFAKTYGPLHRENRHVLEEVSGWQGWVGVARAIVRCGDDLTRGKIGSIEDWTGLHSWIKERPIKMTPGELPPEKDPISASISPVIRPSKKGTNLRRSERRFSVMAVSAGEEKSSGAHGI